MIRTVIATLALATASTVTAAAQVVTLYNTDTARVGVNVGYGGHSVDWETSVDSPVLLFVRFRGGIGQGHWVNLDTVYPPAGTDPLVTRAVASMIISGKFAPDYRLPTPDNVRWYLGAGFAAYFPHGVDMDAQRGLRLLVGVDVSGRRWTVSPEIDLDFPRDNSTPRAGFTDDFLPTARIGLAVRRHF